MYHHIDGETSGENIYINSTVQKSNSAILSMLSSRVHKNVSDIQKVLATLDTSILTKTTFAPLMDGIAQQPVFSITYYIECVVL